MTNKTKIWSFVLLGAIIMGFVFFLNGNSTLAGYFMQKVIDPENGPKIDTTGEEIIAPPWLTPPDETFYTPISLEEYNLTRNSYAASIDIFQLEELIDAPVTQISVFSSNTAPIDTNSVEDKNLREILENNPVSWQILSSLRYKMNGGIIIISVAQPSATAAQIPTILGNETIFLADNTKAWLSTGMSETEGKNRIVFIEQDKIITIAGNLDSNQLKSIADRIEIMK